MTEFDAFAKLVKDCPCVKVKPGVKLSGLQWGPMSPVIESAIVAYDYFDRLVVITSGLDGVHMPGSRHYEGLALDFRTRHLNWHQKSAVRRSIARNLGSDYDVLLERTHLHVEYDPKTIKT